MAIEDLRSNQLEWIRDGANWLVGIGAGVLVLSSTFFFDYFDGVPRARTLLTLAWAALGISGLAGVLTSFSAWKDLKAKGSNDPLGGWVRHSYNVMMWSFAGGYLLLMLGLALNLGETPSAPPETVRIDVGMSEAALTETLGMPARRLVFGTQIILAYPDVTIELTNGGVSRISIR